MPSEGLLLWGKGFEVSRLGAIPWLRDAELHLDTHGFAILHRLRVGFPQTQSFLMDRETLLEHRDRWGREPAPTAARLDRLTAGEAALYSDLVSDALGESVRLEQERVDWAWGGGSHPVRVGRRRSGRLHRRERPPALLEAGCSSAAAVQQ